MIHRAIQLSRFAPLGNVGLLVGAAVDGEGDAAVAPFHARRGQVVQRLADDGNQLGLQFGRVVVDELLLGRVEVVHGAQVVADHRPGVGVRHGQHRGVARQAVLPFQLGAQRLGQVVRDADQVHRDEDDALAIGVFEDERLGPEVGELALRRLGAVGIAGHPHEFVRRDV